MTKGELLYEGKAKKIFNTIENENILWVEYKNSLTAFNGGKKDEMEEKGRLNNQITSNIFRYLKKQGIDSHWLEDVDENTMLCRKVKIIPIEVIVRNKIAGSTAKKFNIAEGTDLEKPLTEFFYKNDDLGDPFISDEQALMLKAGKDQVQLDELKKRALEINTALLRFFKPLKIDLVDFKIEFGVDENQQILLADEISPDTCRLWDSETGEKMDKDRFRRDLGGVIESYKEVLSRINAHWEKEL